MTETPTGSIATLDRPFFAASVFVFHCATRRTVTTVCRQSAASSERERERKKGMTASGARLDNSRRRTVQTVQCNAMHTQ